MRDFFFSLFWATICAFVATWLLLKADESYAFSAEWIFPTVIEFLHNNNIPVKSFVCVFFILLFLLTGLHKLVGHGIRILIGIVGVILIVLVAVFVIFTFLSWMASLL